MPDGGTSLDTLASYEMAGASFLASQPVTGVKPEDYAPSKIWDALFLSVEARLGALRNWRWSWWTLWAELAEYLLPKRYKWLVTANTYNRGNPRNEAIMDGSATQAMGICAAGMFSGLMSPARPWFKLEIGMPGFVPDAAARAWLENTALRTYIVLAQSNFYDRMAQVFRDVVTFGTAVLILYEDHEDLIRGYTPCLGEFYLGAGGRLDVDVLYREFTYTVAQIVEFFGVESCPEQVRVLWYAGKGSLENEFVIAHAIEPNFPLADGAGSQINPIKGGFIYREVYWLKGIKTIQPLSLKGFRERPFFPFLWSTTGNDAYGSDNPGSWALGDSKQLQLITRREAEFLEKLIRPPMGADPELKNEPASINPGKITYTTTANGKKGFWALFEMNPGALAPMTALIEKVTARIEKFFYVDLFQMISQMEGVQPRNELEIIERKGEKIQQLGPVVQLFETQAGAAIHRVRMILARRHMLLPMPKSLQGLPITINYVSMMKLAQRASETSSIEQTMAFGGRLSEAAKAAGLPDPLRIVNLEKLFRDYADMTATSETSFYSPDEVARMDQAKHQEQQQQQQAAGAMSAVQAAQTLAQTPVGQGSTALNAVLGLSGGGPAAPPQ